MYDKPTKILSFKEYEELKKDPKVSDHVIHECAWAHGVQGWEPYNKAHCYYHTGSDYKVSPEIQRQAKRDYANKKASIIKNKGNKLLFTCMGGSFEPKDINYVGNHRIRTSIINDDGKLCFIELGTGRDKDFIRCDHALIYDKDPELCRTFQEKDRVTHRVKVLESMRGDYVRFTKENVLRLVNEHLNCSFSELECAEFFLGCNDYKSVSPGVKL